MPATTNVLRDLHRIHRQLGRRARPARTGGPKQIKARETNLARLEGELNQVKTDVKSARMTADQKQLLLKTGENKIGDLKTKLNQANSNREYQALRDQIAADEMANSVLSDEILEALEKIDEVVKTVTTAEQNLAKGKEDLTKIRHQVCGKQHDSLAEDSRRLELEAKEVEAALPADFRDAYYRIVKSKGSDAMAQVENGTCTGCYQQITQNMHNSLLMGRIVFCQGSCGPLALPARGSFSPAEASKGSRRPLNEAIRPRRSPNVSQRNRKARHTLQAPAEPGKITGTCGLLVCGGRFFHVGSSLICPTSSP